MRAQLLNALTQKGKKMMLKHKSICSSLILMIVMLLCSSMTTYAKEMTEMSGHFDEMEEGTIVGWGWESSSPNTLVPVHVTVTNQETSEVVGDFTPTAGVYRTDLEENGIGNGSHGFRIDMDWESVADGSYLIEGWVDDLKFENTVTYTKTSASQEDTKEAADDSQSAEAADTNGMRSLGVFRTTGYCPCHQCSEGWGRHTSTGAIAQSNHTIAVDPRVIPYGSKVMVNGVVYTAEDRGGGVRGNHIDIFFDTHAQTRQHGNQNLEVFLVA